MKKTYLTVFLCFLFYFGFSQMPGDRVVVIANDKTADENLADLVAQLATDSIGVYQRDDDLKTIITDQIKMEYTSGKSKTWRLLIITAFASDNQILMTSQYRLDRGRKKDTVFNLKRPETMKAFRIKSDIGKKLGEVRYESR